MQSFLKIVLGSPDKLVMSSISNKIFTDINGSLV